SGKQELIEHIKGFNETRQGSKNQPEHYRKLFEALCDNTSLALFILNERQHCVYLNPAAEKLTGYKLAEIQDRALHEIIHHTRPDGSPYPLANCPIDRVLPEDKSVQGEETFVRRDGSFYPIAYTAKALLNEDNLISTIIEIRDLTEERRKETESAKVAATYREFLQATLENISDSFLTLDKDWRFTYVNNRAATAVGRASKELLGKIIWEEFPEAVGTEFYRQMRSVRETGEPAKFEFYYPPLDNWHDFSVYPNLKGGFTIYALDITARKRAEIALSENREVFSLAMQSSQMGAWSRNLVTDEVYWSAELEAIFGLPIGGFSGTINGFYDYVNDEDKARINLEIQQAIDERRDYIIEFRFHHADGSLRWMEGRGKALYSLKGDPIKVYGIGIDVTIRKQAEDDLRESEQRFRNVADAAPVLIWISDTTKKCTWFNKPWLRFTGRTLEQEYGDGWATGVHPDDMERCLDIYFSSFDARVPFSMEYRLRRADGEFRWLLDNGVPRFASNGEFLGFIGSCVDITEHKQAEEALRENQLRLRFALDSANIGDWDLNLLDGTAQRSFLHDKCFGAKEPFKEWSYEQFLNYVHPNDRDQVDRDFGQALAEQKEWHLECRVVWDDKSIHWISAHGNIYRTVDDKPIRMLGIITDITKRKQAEQLIYQSEERLRLAMQTATLGSWDFNYLENNLYWSKSLSKIFGYSNDENFLEIFEDWKNLVHPDDLDAVLAETQSAQTEKRQPVAEYRIVLPENGEIRWISTTGQFIYGDDGSVSRYIGVAQDVTARKLLEAEREILLQSEQNARIQAEEANRLKDEFLATVSHELRTPLNAIIGWATIARQSNFNSEMVKRAIEIIERNGRGQNQIISDILDVSRIITGKLNLDIDSVKLTQVLETAIETLRPAIEAKKIKLTVDFDSRAEIILGDINRLQQIFWNLISNAVKFTSENGNIEVVLKQNGTTAEIYIKDDGEGIDAAFLPYVFDRFRQAEAAENRRYGGLGLGLSIVRHLVEMHGGTVSANSAGKGLGTIFTVRLTLLSAGFAPNSASFNEASDNENQSVEEIFHQSLKGLRILVVDDERDALELARLILENQGAKVSTADSASSALKSFDQELPDLIISDIGMPGADGYDLIQEFRARSTQTGKLIPALALTAYARYEDAERARLAGFQAHLTKPFEADKLIETILMMIS
ncbi:MAG: PAS domain S-box protein, partial [Pyrinomonadaceae bacterium]